MAKLRRPPPNLPVFIAWAKQWQEQYTFWTRLQAVLQPIIPGNEKGICVLIASKQQVELVLFDYRLRELEPAFAFLHSNRAMQFERGGAAINPDGTRVTLRVRPGDRFDVLYDDRLLLGREVRAIREGTA